MKNQIYSIVLFIHVVLGFASLATGLAVMILKKGTRPHVFIGWVYYYGMAGVFLTTLILLGLKPEKQSLWFLSAVAVVSFYQTFTGRRIVQQKKEGLSNGNLDWLALCFLAITGVCTVWGAMFYALSQNWFMTGLFSFFTWIAFATGYQDFKRFTGRLKIGKSHWMFHHIRRMTGSYAATVTAFMVNTIPRYLPEGTHWSVFFLIWVVPGVLIGLFGGRFSRSFLPGNKNAPGTNPILELERNG